MFIKTFPVGPLQCNCTIVADPQKGEAIVVDPGDDADKIIGELKSQGFDVKYLVHTHAHIDHIGATKTVHETCGGEICLHKADQLLYDNINMQAEFLGLLGGRQVLPVTRHIENGDVIEIRGLRLNTLHTPGHTPGSVCFHLDAATAQKPQKFLFAGDTLFMGSIGRTDLWGGDYGEIMASLKERVITLDPDTIVIPGHGPQTTILRERQSNPFLAGLI